MISNKLLSSEEYLGTCPTSLMSFLVEIVNNYSSKKYFIVNVCQDPQHAPVVSAERLHNKFLIFQQR